MLKHLSNVHSKEKKLLEVEKPIKDSSSSRFLYNIGNILKKMSMFNPGFVNKEMQLDSWHSTCV